MAYRYTLEGQKIIRLYYEQSPVIVKAMKKDEEFQEEVCIENKFKAESHKFQIMGYCENCQMV